MDTKQKIAKGYKQANSRSISEKSVPLDQPPMPLSHNQESQEAKLEKRNIGKCYYQIHSLSDLKSGDETHLINPGRE